TGDADLPPFSRRCQDCRDLRYRSNLAQNAVNLVAADLFYPMSEPIARAWFSRKHALARAKTCAISRSTGARQLSYTPPRVAHMSACPLSAHACHPLGLTKSFF